MLAQITPLGVRLICNPPLKNVLTFLGIADLQSATSSLCFWVVGDYKSPGFYRSNLFLRRISNPPGRLAGDFLLTPGGKVLLHHFLLKPKLEHAVGNEDAILLQGD